jgi:hypothetical protein
MKDKLLAKFRIMKYRTGAAVRWGMGNAFPAQCVFSAAIFKRLATYAAQRVVDEVDAIPAYGTESSMVMDEAAAGETAGWEKEVERGPDEFAELGGELHRFPFENWR